MRRRYQHLLYFVLLHAIPCDTFWALKCLLSSPPYSPVSSLITCHPKRGQPSARGWPQRFSPVRLHPSNRSTEVREHCVCCVISDCCKGCNYHNGELRKLWVCSENEATNQLYHPPQKNTPPPRATPKTCLSPHQWRLNAYKVGFMRKGSQDRF